MNLTIKSMARISIIATIMWVLQIALSSIPNIEVVSIIIIAGTIVFGWEMAVAVEVFSLLEIMVWGFGIWNIMYAYIWLVLVGLVCLCKPLIKKYWVVAVVICGFYGLSFGLLCTIPYFIVGGLYMGYTWWIAGIPFDITHCVGNVVTALVLYKPLVDIMKRVRRENG